MQSFSYANSMVCAVYNRDDCTEDGQYGDHRQQWIKKSQENAQDSEGELKDEGRELVQTKEIDEEQEI